MKKGIKKLFNLKIGRFKFKPGISSKHLWTEYQESRNKNFTDDDYYEWLKKKRDDKI